MADQADRATHHGIENLEVYVRLIAVIVYLGLIARRASEVQYRFLSNLTLEVSAETIAAKLTFASWQSHNLYNSIQRRQFDLKLFLIREVFYTSFAKT